MDVSDVLKFVFIAAIIIYQIRKQVKKGQTPAQNTRSTNSQTAQPAEDMEDYLAEIRRMLDQTTPETPQALDHPVSSLDRAEVGHAFKKRPIDEPYQELKTSATETEYIEQEGSAKETYYNEMNTSVEMQRVEAAIARADKAERIENAAQDAHTSARKKVKVDLRKAFIYQTIFDPKF